MKKVIITGADGFIGRYLVWDFIKNNYKVYGIVRNLKKAEKVLGDIQELQLIECEMSRYEELLGNEELKQCDAVLHFAWAGVSSDESQNPKKQLENVDNSCVLMNVTKELGIRKFLYAGSLMEYEHMKAFSNGFYNVSMRNIYHVAKNTARYMLKIIANNNNITFYEVTISNVYGVGEVSKRFINTVMRNMILNKKMGLTAGEQLYDFIYIEDAARAIRLVLEKGENNRDYYIGNKSQRKLKDFVVEMREEINPQYELLFGEIPFRGVTLDYTEFDTKGIYTDCDFHPCYDFKAGVRKTIAWLKEFGINE